MNNLKSKKDSDDAKRFIKDNKDLLIEKFANLKYIPSKDSPFSIFMAGSPGAGKTEFSKSFINSNSSISAARIDADEIKEIIPQYNGHNSDIVQGASALGVEKIYDFVMKNNQNVIVDGTFANYKISQSNIKRSIKKNRIVGIFYIYQDPLIAWDFTRKRGKLEGRYVPKEMFIESFFAARENVKRIKLDFKGKVKIFLIKKDCTNGIEKAWFNVSDIDNHLKMEYTVKSLRLKL